MSVPPPTDRRETPRPGDPARRSQTDRRIPADRRIAPDVFDADTSASVQDIILKTGVLIACPHCNEQLTLGPVVRNQMRSQREVRCARCRKKVVIENLT